MRWYRASQGRLLGLILAGAVLMPWPRPECRGDRVIMKNGMVYVSQGTPDKDNSLVYIWDGLKRVIVRDSKIEKMVAGQRLPDRRAVPVDPADRRPRRLDAQGGPQRGGRPVGRAGPPDVPLPRLEGRTGR